MNKFTFCSSIKWQLILFVSLSIQFLSHAQNQIAFLPDGTKVVLYADKSWDYFKGISYEFDFNQLKDNHIPDFLRQGIEVDKVKLQIAIEMYLQGWRYIMPQPKSDQAEWGNYDKRTTWWFGYWHNNKTLEYSRNIPEKKANGYYDGDEQDDTNTYGRIGSPVPPNVFEWLLSSRNGIKPTNSGESKPKSYQSKNFQFN